LCRRLPPPSCFLSFLLARHPIAMTVSIHLIITNSTSFPRSLPPRNDGTIQGTWMNGGPEVPFLNAPGLRSARLNFPVRHKLQHIRLPLPSAVYSLVPAVPSPPPTQIPLQCARAHRTFDSGRNCICPVRPIPPSRILCITSPDPGLRRLVAAPSPHAPHGTHLGLLPHPFVRSALLVPDDSTAGGKTSSHLTTTALQPGTPRYPFSAKTSSSSSLLFFHQPLSTPRVPVCRNFSRPC
jgi:hypothetical protein